MQRRRFKRNQINKRDGSIFKRLPVFKRGQRPINNKVGMVLDMQATDIKIVKQFKDLVSQRVKAKKWKGLCAGIGGHDA